MKQKEFLSLADRLRVCQWLDDHKNIATKGSATMVTALVCKDLQLTMQPNVLQRMRKTRPWYVEARAKQPYAQVHRPTGTNGKVLQAVCRQIQAMCRAWNMECPPDIAAYANNGL